LLNPKKSWTGCASFHDEVNKLAELFNQNFTKYSDQATPEVIAAGPIINKIATEIVAPVETKAVPIILPLTTEAKPIVESEKVESEKVESEKVKLEKVKSEKVASGKVESEKVESEKHVQLNGERIHVNGEVNASPLDCHSH